MSKKETEVRVGPHIYRWVLVRPEDISDTDEKAKFYLGKNYRKLNKAKLAKYEADYRDGRWIENSPNIIVLLTGTNIVIDGQHRLTVIKDVGKPCYMQIKTNGDYSMVIDRGMARKLIDALRFNGVDNSKQVEIALSYLHKFNVGVAHVEHTLAPEEELLALLKANPEIEKYVERIATQIEKSFKPPAGLMAALLYYVSEGRWGGLCEVFVQGVCNGNNLDKDNPLLVLRNHLNELTISRKVRMSDKVAAIINGWNLLLQGMCATTKTIKRDGRKPFPLPIRMSAIKTSAT